MIRAAIRAKGKKGHTGRVRDRVVACWWKKEAGMEINSLVFVGRDKVGGESGVLVESRPATGTTKPYGNSCFKLKIRRQRGSVYRQTIETMDARWFYPLYTGRMRRDHS